MKLEPIGINKFVTEEDITIMAAQTPKVQAQWWCMLNSWKWPAEIPNEFPPVPHEQYTPENRRSYLMAWLESRIGHKACNREWNIDRMTDEEHENWWAGRGLPVELQKDDE